ncbi:hypothetical protein CEXT_423441 [Caerostris extrusa]|uniref:Uncharacterized protein n=1 Tax=Caerostris extrusa TaxID=172846 RepID=A0AAV4V665_CAEEX|nr:hypothetical protein CEXT_423441 [Caerostris extrusa]
MVTKKTELIIPSMLSSALLQLTRVINRGDDDFSYWVKNKERVLPTVGEWLKEICYRVVAGHVHFCSGYERLRTLHFHQTKCYYRANSVGVVLIV